MNKFPIVISVVSLIVGLIAILMTAFGGHASPAPVSLGGQYEINNVAPSFATGADFGSLPVNYNWVGGKILAKSNTAFWKNTTGQTLYFENVEAATDGTASSTYKLYAYATTSAPRTLYDFTAPSGAAGTALFIKGFNIATSSTATTTSSDDSIGSSGPSAGSVVAIPNNSYVIWLLSSPGIGCPSSGGVCESATSTNRGFNIQWRAVYHN